MTIVLFILKIIGVVILVLLGILLLVLAAVLFVPFRYQVCVESDGQSQDSGESGGQDFGESDGQSQDSGESDGQLQVCVTAGVHWLLHFLGARVNYRDGQLDAYLRILFWKKKLLNNKEAQEDEAKFEKDAKAAAKDAAEEAVKPPQRAKADAEEKRQIISIDKEPEERQNSPKSTTDTGKQSKAAETDTGKQPKATETDTGKRQKDAETGSEENQEEENGGIIDRIRKLWHDFSDFRKKITRMVEDEGNHRAAAHLKTELLRLLRSIRPRKLSMDLEFSLGSPDLTGEVLGVCAWFPICYQSGNRLIPDFEAEKAYARGRVDAKGRIYLFGILVIVLRILFDKDCKRMYRMFRKYF